MKPAPYLFSGPNWLYGAFGGKIVLDINFAQFCLRSPLKLVFPKYMFSVGFFWWKRPHTSFLGLIGYMVHSRAKLFLTKTLFNFASKALLNSFFQKTHFRFEFLYQIAPHLFSWLNGLDGTIGGKSVPEWSFVYRKKHVFGWNFLMKPASYLFSGPNWLYGAFRGKIVPNENFAQFCLRSPLKFVFPKRHVFGWNFLMKPSPYLFSGPNWLYGAFGGKIVPDENFTQFYLKSPLELFFQKTRFPFEFLY